MSILTNKRSGDHQIKKIASISEYDGDWNQMWHFENPDYRKNGKQSCEGLYTDQDSFP